MASQDAQAARLTVAAYYFPLDPGVRPRKGNISFALFSLFFLPVIHRYQGLKKKKKKKKPAIRPAVATLPSAPRLDLQCVVVACINIAPPQLAGSLHLDPGEVVRRVL